MGSECEQWAALRNPMCVPDIIRLLFDCYLDGYTLGLIRPVCKVWKHQADDSMTRQLAQYAQHQIDTISEKISDGPTAVLRRWNNSNAFRKSKEEQAVDFLAFSGAIWKLRQKLHAQQYPIYIRQSHDFLVHFAAAGYYTLVKSALLSIAKKWPKDNDVGYGKLRIAALRAETGSAIRRACYNANPTNDGRYLEIIRYVVEESGLPVDLSYILYTYIKMDAADKSPRILAYFIDKYNNRRQEYFNERWYTDKLAKKLGR